MNMTSEFDWQLYPELEQFLNQEIEFFLSRNQASRILHERMFSETSTRFFDWIDHIVLPESRIDEEFLVENGYRVNESLETTHEERVFTHPTSTFFPVLLTCRSGFEVALKPEKMDYFLLKYQNCSNIEGKIQAPYRKVMINKQNEFVLSAVERRGYRGFRIQDDNGDYDVYAEVLERFTIRERYFKDDEEGSEYTLSLIKERLRNEALSPERVTDAFFRAERLFWQRRDKAGQVQKTRQDQLGLGWGNHDHHTFRSSRRNFHLLIELFELLGFKTREQFYAGEAAGWGAQVLEHPICNLTIFADVDISIQEKNKDFAHKKMDSTEKLGTVGLWVALHGESILGGGMHHLAVLVDFEKTRRDLTNLGVKPMRPFSSFAFLQQAFVESERRPIKPERLNKLAQKGILDVNKRNNFEVNGAVSSHIEIIQRDQGFKGFNQDSVSAIIKNTDPRTYKGGVNA
jgi:hypothetical protein